MDTACGDEAAEGVRFDFQNFGGLRGAERFDFAATDWAMRADRRSSCADCLLADSDDLQSEPSLHSRSFAFGTADQVDGWQWEKGGAMIPPSLSVLLFTPDVLAARDRYPAGDG